MAHDDYTACKEAWFQWNLNSCGTDAKTLGTYRYDGPIFYDRDSPSQRLIKNRHNKWVMVYRYLGNLMPDWAKDMGVKCVASPDIAVF